jgi:hypothetical protein
MIVNDFNRAGASFRPGEADPVLSIYADRIPSCAVSFERFKCRADSGEIGEPFSGIEKDQLPERDPLNVSELEALFAIEDLFGFGAAERSDHKTICIPCHV